MQLTVDGKEAENQRARKRAFRTKGFPEPIALSTHT